MRSPFAIIVYILISAFIKAGTPSIIFKENKGQWPEKVLFGADIFNTQFYINKNSFNYCVYSYADLKTGEELHHTSLGKNSILHGHNYEVNFVGADLNKVSKSKELPEYYNYFLGNNKSKWANYIKAYGNLLFSEIYEGVDLKIYSTANLKYDFIVKPGGNVNSLKLNYRYVDAIGLVNNELIIKTSVGNVIEKEPFAYQIINGKQKQVKCKFTLLSNNTVGFVFTEGYNKNYELVIDPTVIVCSYSGSSSYCLNSGCTNGENGEIFTISRCGSGYQTTLGAFQVTIGGIINYLVSGYTKTGSSKIFSTYIGGDSLDDPFCIVAREKELVIMGRTCSKNFPTTTAAFDSTFNGLTDIAISKLNVTGSSLIASTYVGGNAPECNNWFANVTVGDFYFFGECITDSSGNVFAISNTQSSNFPVTTGAIDTILNGGIDACVFKLDKNLSNLVWSTYLGGSTTEDGKSIRLDGNGGVYCLGTTNSINFPTTPGCISNTKIGGSTDYFITHINALGNTIINSTYVGTTANDVACLLDLDDNNDVYFCGQTNNPSLIIPTSGVYSNTNGYNTIYKINSTLNNIVFRTKYGNLVSGKFPYLMTSAFKVDSCANIYIAGFADNVLPTTSNAFMPYGGGTRDIYVGVFKNNCSSLLFASFYGGPQTERTDGGISHFDSKGVLYQGFYVDGAIPTTTNAFSPIQNASVTDEDGFLKIDLQTHIKAGSSYGANITGCPPFSTQFVSTTNTGTSYWDLGDGTTSTFDTISHTYNNLGTYNVLLVVTDTNTCNRTDSIKSILNVINPTTFDLGDEVSICINNPTQLISNVSAVTYSWSTGQTTPNIFVTQPGTYTLTINNGGCITSDEVKVVIGEEKLSERFPNVITPNSDNINDWIDFMKYNFDEVEFIVFDRWGKERYKITNITERWSPDDLNNGTYYYVANYKSSCTGKYATDKGFISVFK
ncbi:MAG: gliding motility-associated C-terminal domain-containing protein [Bacteroidia bacterium]|nr:gliding motility-associated C-terminal domain-containing protein [Bacteroidia bacterium]